jgi:hypothetical protein
MGCPKKPLGYAGVSIEGCCVLLSRLFSRLRALHLFLFCGLIVAPGRPVALSAHSAWGGGIHGRERRRNGRINEDRSGKKEYRFHETLLG